MKNLEITSKRQSNTITGEYEGFSFYLYYEVNYEEIDGISFIWDENMPENYEEIEQQIVNYIINGKN